MKLDYNLKDSKKNIENELEEFHRNLKEARDYASSIQGIYFAYISYVQSLPTKITSFDDKIKTYEKWLQNSEINYQKYIEGSKDHNRSFEITDFDLNEKKINVY